MFTSSPTQLQQTELAGKYYIALVIVHDCYVLQVGDIELGNPVCAICLC